MIQVTFRKEDMENANGNNKSNSPNEETNYKNDKLKNLKLGKKLKEIVEKEVEENYRPLRGLSKKVLQSIANTQKAQLADREMAARELQKRKEENDDSRNPVSSLKEDLKNNYIAIDKGRIYSPTEGYKKFRDDIKENKNNSKNTGWYQGTQREPLMSLDEVESSFDQTTEIIDDILNKDCNPKDLSRKVEKAYVNVYRLGLAKDNVEEPMMDEVCGNLNLNLGIPELAKRYIRAGKNSTLVRIATDFFHDHQTELIKGSVSEVLKTTDLREKKQEAAEYVIKRGKFLPKTIEGKPEEADRLLEEIGVDKKSEHIVYLALNGYDAKADEGANGDTISQINIANYFNLTEGLWNAMKSPNAFIPDRNGNLIILDEKDHYDRKTGKIIQRDTEVGKELYQRLKDATNERLDQIKMDPEGRKLLEEAKQKAAINFRTSLEERIIGDFDFSALDLGVQSISSANSIDTFKLSKMLDGFPFKHLISYKEVKGSLGENVEVDPVKITKEALMDILRSGTKDTTRKMESRWSNKRESITVTAMEVFNAENYQKNKDKIGIDFADPEVFQEAFTGLLNTMHETNGAKSEQASWYFENVFMNDPERFEEELEKQYKTSDRGDKSRITTFRNEIMGNSQAYFEYCGRRELDKITGIEEDAQELNVPNFLEATTYNELKAFIDEYIRKRYARDAGRLGTKIDTFTEREDWRMNKGDGDGNRRKKTPDYFGPTKLAALLELGRSLEKGGQVGNVQFLSGVFPGENKEGTTFEERYGKANFNDDMTYHGFAFDYEGHRCAIFESLNDVAATYFFRGEADDDPIEFFNNSKRENFYNNPKVARASHLSPEHTTDSINEVHKKGFLFFRTGDNKAVNYSTLGGRKIWNEYFNAEFPAYPMSLLEEPAENRPNLERYKEWQNSAGQTPNDMDERLIRRYLSGQ